jgi:hypothetical protein
MAWINTDTDVARALVVRKTVSGQAIPGYPRQYSILNEFTGHPSITSDAWSKMDAETREDRIEAFKTYVNQLENINVDDTAINEVYRPAT